MKISKTITSFSIFLLISVLCIAQSKVNLAEQFQKENIVSVNRTISLYGDQLEAIEMNAMNSDGLGILKNVAFTNGTINLEILGENNPGKSFVGFAFNIQDNSTYEVVYFRPFNFVAKEQIRKEHMVQYIFHPEFTWRKLREERTGEFESEIKNPPNPEAWIPAKIKISDKLVNVYLEGRSEPVLTVDRLSLPKSDKIGLWTGFGSSGRFRNLTFIKE